MSSLFACVLMFSGPTHAAEPEPLSGEPFATLDLSDGVPRPSGDLNGDGFDDLVQATYDEQGVLTVHYGGARELHAVQRIEIASATAWPARDVNGDGYDDVVNVVNGGAEADSLELLCGGSDGLSGVACATQALSRNTASAGPAGDLDDDGFADAVVVGYWDLHVVYGAPAGFRAKTTTLSQPVEDDVFDTDYPVVAADVNGDGFDDLVVATKDDRILLYLGSSGGLETAAADEVGAPLPSGAVLAAAGDVNGDCHADIVVGTSRGTLGAAYVLYGGEDGFGPETLEEAETMLVGTPGTQFGGQVAGAGDVNADGYADVLIGSYGATFLYLGGPDGVSATPAATRGDPSANDGYCACLSSYVTGAGDVDHDGVDDAILQDWAFGDHDLMRGFATMAQRPAPDFCPAGRGCGCASSPGLPAAAMVGAAVVAVLRRRGRGAAARALGSGAARS